MKTAVVIASENLGRGDDELGARLMVGFLRKLWASTDRPEVMVFLNSGVRLLIEGSPVLDSLVAIRESGVDLVGCGTCVQHFDVREKIKVGRVSNMQEMVEILMSADKVVTL
jgi:selenium metabolism protein YedF